MEIQRVETQHTNIGSLKAGDVFRYSDGTTFYCKIFLTGDSLNAVSLSEGRGYVVSSAATLVKVKGKFVEEV